MRAKIKRRQRMRRLTIVATLVIIAASLAVGIYLVSTLGGSGNPTDGRPLSQADLATLHQLSMPSNGNYGPSNGSGLAKVYSYSGTAFSGAKPIVVYVGAEYCQYCAISRWGLVLALDRFGNFSGLEYMHSSVGEFNLATFTFVHAKYTSQYFTFEAYEAADRNGNPLSPPPTNYTSIWQGVNSESFPFVDFNNRFVLKGSLIPDPTIIQNRNHTQIFADIRSGDVVGQEILQSANMITGVICKMMGGVPSVVCSAPPINSITSGLAAPVAGSISIVTPQTKESPTRTTQYKLFPPSVS